MHFIKGHWQLIILTAAVFALWHTPIMVPLKILIVFLHELSHAATVVLTGGKVESLTVSAQQGGLVESRGGSRFLTLTAGYLGSLLIGAAILLVALRSRADRIVVACFGVIMLLIAALYVRDGFALLFIVGTGIVMLAMSRYMGHQANDLLLRVIGLSSLLYVPYDIFSDTIARSSQRSDARMLAEEFGGSTILWGVAWLIVSLVVIYMCLRRVLGRRSNISWR